jgi:hypothetical protein
MKQQHILLFSDRRPSAVELPVLVGDGCRLTYCASDDRNIARIEQLQNRFDWVLVDGAALGGEKKEFFRSLRAMGLLMSPDGAPPCDAVRCRVEWDANGTLQLRCAGRRGLGPFAGCRNADIGAETPGLVFEYHAPMKRTG